MAQSALRGKFIAATNSHYDFTADDGRHMVGETYTLWLDQGTEVAPADVRTKDASLFAEVAAAGAGVVWELTCDLNARNNKVVWTAVSGRRAVAAANGIKAAA